MSTDNEKSIVSLYLSSFDVVVKVRLESYNGIRKIESDFRLPQFSSFFFLRNSCHIRHPIAQKMVSSQPIRSVRTQYALDTGFKCFSRRGWIGLLPACNFDQIHVVIVQIGFRLKWLIVAIENGSKLKFHLASIWFRLPPLSTF